ncbi:MAB_1171c family putative transporter [Streptomyces erythrochromogenes]|uniref:MAB_1171c family putative transporter n=1 Tax=Streptomyces erythrochromogenes TaxID=285574 RepID=UPI00030C0BD8
MYLIFLVLLAAAITWKVFQLIRAPKDGALRSVTLCLVCAALSYPLAMPGGASGVDTVAGYGAAKLGQNLLLLGTMYFLMCFYLYSASEHGASRRRARVEAVVVLAVAAVITVAATTVPHETFAGSFSTADMTVPQLAVFYGVAGLYLMYSLAAAGVWTVRYARMSPRPHATGLWIAAVGLLAMALACAVRAVFVLVRWAGGVVPHSVMAAVAMLLVLAILSFVTGVSYSAARSRLSALRLWWEHRRGHRRLAPLWELLAARFPEVVLQGASSRLERWGVRGVHRRYHRRVVECRDGLVRISPYLGDLETEELMAMSPDVLADRLRTAAQGPKAAEAQPVIALAVPQRDDRNADAVHLFALSDALRTAA